MSAQVGGRGLIHKGDSTTTGGVVTQGLGNVMLVGEGATQIEMIATCPICEKGWGKIVPIEKWDVFIDNVQAALDGDFVMCDCPVGSNTLIASASAMRFSKVDGQIHGFKPHASTQEMDATYQSMVNALAEGSSAVPPSSPASRQGAQELKSKPEVVKALRLKSPLLKQSLTLDKLANRESHSYKSGARGQEVEYIQQALIKLGFDLGNAGADGEFGPTTKRQVEQFQKEYQETNNTHLAYQVGTIDGIVGQGTLLGLDEALVEGWERNTDVNQAELNVRAFMRMLRVGEGTTGDKGYETLFGGSSFIQNHGKDWSDHPRIHVPFGQSTSTAAGAYQVMEYVWDDPNMNRLRNRYGIDDFSPYNQDLFAIVILKHKRKSAWPYLITGDIEKALTLSSGTKGYAWEWASLPPGVYGQPSKTMSEALSIFDKYLKEERSGTTDLKILPGEMKRYLQ